MKKIYLIRSKKNQFGGAENYLSRLSNNLDSKGIEYEVIYSKFPNFFPSWIKALAFNFQLKITKRSRFYFSLERISNPDIYRAGDGVHKAFLDSYNKSSLNPLHFVYIFLEKKCFNNAKKIIVNSQMVKNEIEEYYGINQQKIELIYNGFDAIKLNYKDSLIRISNEFNLNEPDFILLYVGSGFRRKGVKSFLRILSMLNNKNFKAFIIGKESKIYLYKKLAKEYSLEDKVFFTGPREDVNDFYNVSDFFILPTHYEPFGNVVLEAMSFGNVVFTTKKNGASEIIDPKFIMETPDDYSVVKKIDNLLKDKSLLSKIKFQNKEISKNFTVERNTNETLKIIDETLN